MLALAIGVASAASYAPAHARLQEEQLRLPVQVQDAAGKTVAQDILVTVFSDDANRRPMPVAVIAHGRPADSQAKADMGRARYGEAARYFVKRGYLVAVPTRVGYGATGGPDVESSGNCERRNFAPGFAAASQQLQAVLAAMRQRPGVAQAGALLVGHSYGGIAALQAAAAQPKTVRAVLNFSGGAGGDPKTRPGQPCSTFQLAQQLRQIGQSSRTPSLWLYAENDRYFGSSVPRQWFSAYRNMGGIADYVAVRKVGADGHTLFTHSTAVWQPIVTRWLQQWPAKAA